MNIVSNSSPIIFLSKIGKIDLLNNLFSKVYIPQAVYSETVLADKSDDVSRVVSEKIKANQIEIYKVQNETAIKALTGRLHLGEVEVIIGADELGVKSVVLDDLYARNKAKQFKLSVTGTLGILLLASRQGLITDIEIELENLIDAGFRVSDDLIEEIIQKAGKL